MPEDAKELIVVFEVGPLTVSVPALDIHEILQPPDWITTVPEAPPAVRGVFGHRSEVVAAISVRSQFGFPKAPKGVSGELMLARFERDLAGFWVDRVVDVTAATGVEWLELPSNFRHELFDKAFQYKEIVALHTDGERLYKLAGAKELALPPGLIQAAEEEKERQRLAREAEELRALEEARQRESEEDVGQEGTGDVERPDDLGRVVADLAEVRRQREAEGRDNDVEYSSPYSSQSAAASSRPSGFVREIRRASDYSRQPVRKVASYAAHPGIGNAPAHSKAQAKPTSRFVAPAAAAGSTTFDFRQVAPSPAPAKRVDPLFTKNLHDSNSDNNSSGLAASFGWAITALAIVALVVLVWTAVSDSGTDSNRRNSSLQASAAPQTPRTERPVTDRPVSRSPVPTRPTPIVVRDVAAAQPATAPQTEPVAQPGLETVAAVQVSQAVIPVPGGQLGPVVPADIVHLVRDGDTLWDLAARYLGNPFLYPLLADWSDIRNPHRIEPGEQVRIRR